MRHLNTGRQLSRTASHRKAMLANLAVSLLDKERVRTTVAKAKEVRRVVERLITYGKKGSLHAIRLAAKKMRIRNASKVILKKLFTKIAPMFKDREGGYTRIIKLGTRKGDNAEMAIIELVGRKVEAQPVKEKTEKSAGAKKKKVEGKTAQTEAAEIKEETKEKPVTEPQEVAKEKPKERKAKKEEVKKEKIKKTPKTKKADEEKKEKKDTKKSKKE